MVFMRLCGPISGHNVFVPVPVGVFNFDQYKDTRLMPKKEEFSIYCLLRGMGEKSFFFWTYGCHSSQIGFLEELDL